MHGDRKSLVQRLVTHGAEHIRNTGVLLLVLVMCLYTGVFEPVDNAFMDARFKLSHRTPSDSLIIVEIDPQSIRKEARWPWSRDRYAKVVENLQGAGAELIAFDIDFSSLSDPEGDRAFSVALNRRPGEVILPVFWQWSSSANGKRELLKTPPNSFFLNDAIIASVTLTAEKNGVVRRGWRAVEEDGLNRTSIAGVLAGIPANRQSNFYIDYSINAAAITRISFHDVLTGRFSPEMVRGKHVLIGATALELGDEFAAPALGVTPGVVLHALSYESLIQNRAILRPHPAVPFSIALMLLFWLIKDATRKRAFELIITHIAVSSLLLITPFVLQLYFPVSFDVGVIIGAQFISLLFVIGARLKHRAQQIIRHRAATIRFHELASIIVRENTDGVIVTDGSGAIELCNDRAEELIEFKSKPAPGANINEICDCLRGSVRNHGGYEQFEFTNNNGNTLEASISSRAITTGKERGAEKNITRMLIVYTIRDISARKRIEIAEREAKEAAMAADNLKTQLISNMSHELRTPLNGVIGFAGILMNESFGPLGVPEYKEYSQNIHDSGKRLLGLVNDMLNIAKLDAGGFELCKDPVSLEDVIEGVAASYETLAQRNSSNVILEIQKPLPDAEADASILKEMLSHLIRNAITFAGDNAQIIIRALRCENTLTIEVEDNGAGVDASALPKLTDVFFQADSALNRTHEGAGLGLYLVSKFAALHNAALELESEKGARFLARIKFADVFDSYSSPGASDDAAHLSRSGLAS